MVEATRIVVKVAGSVVVNFHSFSSSFVFRVSCMRIILSESDICREWSDKNQLWVQYVSSTPATRLDVINLQEQLDHKLQQRQARETGICPVREELYAQCFDELIRQITINCAERGLLLLRLRDEYRMTVAAFQTLYESSIAFGMRKALLAEQRKIDIKNRINELQNKSGVLDRQIEELTQKCDQVEQEEEAKVEEEEKQHQEQVAFLKESNEQLKKNLEALLSAPKK